MPLIIFGFDYSRLDRIDRALAALLAKVTTMANDVTKLEATVDALGAKVDEANSTLAGLAREVVDLLAKIGNQPPDIQADIDRIAGKAQGALDRLTAAEDAADDQLPPAQP